MNNFFRSLKYLWPYRLRLGVAMVCVVLIAILWAGGLGALLPGAKILISSEGLHGWAFRKMSQDRLAMERLEVRNVNPEQKHRIDDTELVLALDMIQVRKEGPTAKAGIAEGVWIVGLDDGQEDHHLLPPRKLMRMLSGLEAGTSIRLRIYDPYSHEARWVGPIELSRAGYSTRLLARLAESLPDDQFRLLLMLLGFGVVITLLRDLLRFLQEYLVQTTVYRGLMDLRCDNYNVVLHMPTTFFSEKGVSDSMSRFMQDTGELVRGQITLFGKTLVEPGKAIASIAVAMMISWRLTLLTMVVGPPVFILIYKFGKIMKRASRRALESWASMLAVLKETLTGIRVVKAYTMEGSERKRFFRVNRALLKQQRRMAAIDSATAPVVEAIGIVAAMGAIAIAGYWVLHGWYDMDRDRFFALMACLAAMFDPIRKLAHVNTRFQRADAAAARIFELHDQPQEKSVPNAPMLPSHSESIEFRGVNFRYPSAVDDVLKDINLKITSGQTVAIVGPNGSGKTTLVSLVPRLFDPTSGTVLVDGCDISQYSVRSLRRQIGLVTQETILFNATIAENIAYGLRRPRSEDVLAAAKKAFVDEFVANMPDGYDTMVSEQGASLSGGQRQRIAIARAILRDPAILIFDEAMSQVDADSERRIHQAMEEFIKDRTTLIVAHRFATVLSADRIAVMNAGRIVDTGSHKDLLESCDLYRHLYQTQFIDSGGTE